MFSATRKGVPERQHHHRDPEPEAAGAGAQIGGDHEGVGGVVPPARPEMVLAEPHVRPARLVAQRRLLPQVVEQLRVADVLGLLQEIDVSELHARFPAISRFQCTVTACLARIPPLPAGTAGGRRPASGRDASPGFSRAPRVLPSLHRAPSTKWVRPVEGADRSGAPRARTGSPGERASRALRGLRRAALPRRWSRRTAKGTEGVAEAGGSRTHRARLTRPNGFEVRTGHRTRSASMPTAPIASLAPTRRSRNPGGGGGSPRASGPG